MIKENLPVDFRNNSMVEWIKVVISPFINIYGEFTLKYQIFIYQIGFTFQVMYLEKVLNNKFDPTNEGIYIVDGGITQKNYLYRKSESKPPKYKYRRWKQSINYVVGDYAIYENKVYRCIANNVHFNPALNPAKWVFHADVRFRRRTSEFNLQYDFIVKVPATVTFDVIEMRATIDFYRYAGKRYKIEILP